jgi:hypothetical protein
MSRERKGKAGKTQGEAPARHVRLEQELRANLLKRKAQAKLRKKDAPAGDRDEGRQS